MRQAFFLFCYFFLITEIYCQDTIYAANHEIYIFKGLKKTSLDSMVIVNSQLDKKLKKFVNHAKPDSSSFVTILYRQNADLIKDTVFMEAFLDTGSAQKSIELYKSDGLGFTYINSILILIPDVGFDTTNIFFKRSGKSKDFYTEDRKYILKSNGNNLSVDNRLFAFYKDKDNKLKCKNGKRLLPLFYKKQTWIRKHVLYRKQARKFGFI